MTVNAMQEAVEERAAILEYDANISRVLAEVWAGRMVVDEINAKLAAMLTEGRE